MPKICLTDDAPWGAYRNFYLEAEVGLPTIGQEPVEVSKEAAEYLLGTFPGCFRCDDKTVAPVKPGVELEPEPDIAEDQAAILDHIEGLSAAEASAKIYEGDFDGYLAVILDEEKGDSRKTVRAAAQKRITKISRPPE